eukprot:GHVU01007176.1.p1 GENE.GHVU01007176.1~~GHVU01007176.1.p1  ORF type:complete len:127 (+),score=21.33 GHVU01007176.1:257-637(+)
MRCRRGGYKFFFMRSRSCLCGHSFGLKSPRVAPAECNYRCGLAGGEEGPPESRLDDDDDDDETTIPIRTPCGGREAVSAFDTRGKEAARDSANEAAAAAQPACLPACLQGRHRSPAAAHAITRSRN